MRRCSVSIPSNITEGRRGTNEFVHFLDIACGALCELQTQLELSLSLNLVDKEAHDPAQDQTKQIGRLLNGFINR